LTWSLAALACGVLLNRRPAWPAVALAEAATPPGSLHSARASLLAPFRSLAVSTSGRLASLRTLTEKITGWSERRRKNFEARAAELVAEEMSLQDLRRADRLTQARVGKTLKIGQDGVSRLEQRSDLLISTLRSYVEAMGV
jgi:hypothetical protein